MKTTTSTQTQSGPSSQDHILINKAALIPVTEPTAVFSISPLSLSYPERKAPLQFKVSAPVRGDALPIILLSHGQGQSNNLSSLNGYGPLAHFYAAHGFVVIQPTHLSSKTLGLTSEDPKDSFFWRSRVNDMKRIIDGLDEIQNLVPELKGRLDKSRIAIVGHSMGGHTASMLLGAQLTDHNDGTIENVRDARIVTGVILAAPGKGDSQLNPSAAERLPFFKSTDFSNMKTPALVVYGDSDNSTHLSLRGADWHQDPYSTSPGPKSLLTLVGGGHGLGGVSGYDAGETDDESPERLAIVQRVTLAYLQSQLYQENTVWEKACNSLQEIRDLAFIESK